VKTAEAIINDTGYPLQIHLRELITQSQDKHGWHVLAFEHRWENARDGEEGFIDLILDHGSYVVRLIVECKRISGNWYFLIPRNRAFPTDRAKILHAQFPPPTFEWHDFRISPESDQANFSVLATGGKKDSRTLETLAGQLLLSMEALAVQEMSFRNDSVSAPWRNRFYLPIIVTTAKLQKCTFNPLEIDPDDGSLRDADIQPLNLVRFRKPLASNQELAPSKNDDIPTLNAAAERTVLIVQASYFLEYLRRFRFE